MRSNESAGVIVSAVGKLASFVSSVGAQIRAAIQIGVPSADGAETPRVTEYELPFGASEAQLWDDAPGRMTRNGLGSLEIGAGKTRVDE